MNKLSKESTEIKGLIRDQVDMGTFGLVELELYKLDSKTNALTEQLESIKQSNDRYKQDYSECQLLLKSQLENSVKLKQQLAAKEKELSEVKYKKCVHPFENLEIDKTGIHHFCNKCSTFIYRH